jgi:hypothetical protein
MEVALLDKTPWSTTTHISLLAVAYFTTAVGILTCAASAQSAPYHYNGQIYFDVKRVPFSRFDSYLSISDLGEFQPPLRRSGLYLRTMHESGRDAFRLELIRGGVTIPFTESATPTLLTLSAEAAFVQISFQGPNRLRIRGHGAGLQLTADEAWFVPYQHRRWEINTTAMKYMLLPVHGRIDTVTVASGQDARANVLTLEPAQDTDAFETELDAYILHVEWQQKLVPCKIRIGQGSGHGVKSVIAGPMDGVVSPPP